MMFLIDTVAIISIVVHVMTLSRETFGLSKIPGIIFRDVTIQILVIFVSHLSLVLSVNIARVCALSVYVVHYVSPRLFSLS